MPEVSSDSSAICVVGQMGCGRFNEESVREGEADLFCGEDGIVLCEGSDFDASARGE